MENLNELNVRQKWSTGTHTIKQGTLVVLKEKNTPCQQWELGRVLETFPGSDGIIRTVTVKTASDILKSCVKQLSPLLIQVED